MTIDGTDISKYGAKQWNVTPSFAGISNSSEWIEGAASPLMLPGTAGMKEIKVSVLIYGASREEIWRRGSDLVARLLKPSVIRLDGFDHNFLAVLKNPEQAESSIQRWHKATLKLTGYEYGDEVSTTTSSRNFIITNEGNLETPATLELTAAAGFTQVTITGLTRDRYTGAGKPLIVNKVYANKKIVIDYENGIITEAGANKFTDVEMWDFPSLMPGKNNITVDKNDISITVKYKPRFM